MRLAATVGLLLAAVALPRAATAGRAKHARLPPPPPPRNRSAATPDLVAAASVPVAAAPAAAAGADPFPVPEGLEDAVAFWESVYSKYSSHQVVMHDNRYLGIVYEVLDYSSLDDGKRTEAEIDDMIDDKVEEEKKRIVNILLGLAAWQGQVPEQRLTAEEKKIYRMFDPVDELDKFTAAAERVRGQTGQKDKFLHGIGDVAPYMPRMEEIFRSRGLPEDLSRLTFVESMFNLHAYSKVGAAGPWQFMSGTGRLFLTIKPEIDERMDPLKAADAAARLLAFNYRELGNWGLALTAYNHGVGGMRRAVREVGSEEIGQIVWAYDSRSFGFASRNFYAEFLAAREVYDHRDKWFGAALKKVAQKPPLTWDEVVLPEHVPLSTFLSYTGLAEDQIRDLNPALTRYVYSGAKYLPKGYPIKVPTGQAKTVVAAYARIPRALRFAEQKPNEFHLVRRGETLARIARHYGMSVDALMNLNGMGPGSRLLAGRKLRVLPEGKAAAARVAIASNEKRPKVKILPAVKLPEDETPPPETPPSEMSEEEAEVLAAADAPAEDGTTGSASAPSKNPGTEINGLADAGTPSAAVPTLPSEPAGPTLLSMVAHPFGILSPAASMGAGDASGAPDGAGGTAAPDATPRILIPDSALELALLEPGARGMAAPPEPDTPADAAPVSHEPSPLAGLHDAAPSHHPGHAAVYPGGIRCDLTAR